MGKIKDIVYGFPFCPESPVFDTQTMKINKYQGSCKLQTKMKLLTEELSRKPFSGQMKFYLPLSPMLLVSLTLQT